MRSFAEAWRMSGRAVASELCASFFDRPCFRGPKKPAETLPLTALASTLCVRASARAAEAAAAFVVFMLPKSANRSYRGVGKQLTIDCL
jgi:hypothetical protein